MVSESSNGGPSSSSSLTSSMVISLALVTKRCLVSLSGHRLQNKETGFFLWDIKRKALEETGPCRADEGEGEGEDEAEGEGEVEKKRGEGE